MRERQGGRRRGKRESEKRKINKERASDEEEERGTEGGGRGQSQCALHMTDALGLLLNGFPVGRS